MSNDQINTGRPKRGQKRFVTPSPGYDECYECGGDGACVICGGEGRVDDALCTYCHGTGRCIVCRGAGQIRKESGAAGTKRVLRLIGNFREMGYADEADAPSLVTVKGRRTSEHKSEVVSYLRKAESVSFSPGFLDDFFDATKLIGTHTMRTDGFFIWPDFLAGYVEHYDVELPLDFELHMAKNQWHLPTKLNREEFDLPW